ncbi:MAG: pyridoxamine 5'-phosphate oxidase [Planctomycetota bacterium]
MGDQPFQGMRVEYGDAPLQRAAMPADPFVLFREWLDAARAAQVNEPNGMALATCDAGGQPQSRIVLLKLLDDSGLTFFTNKDSDKGQQLRGNARAAATFWWPLPRNRQVRVVGPIEPTAEAVSDRYFAERPRRAQLCSAASPQSRVVASRAELERLVDALARQVGDGPVPRPPHWGGYVLVPRTIEFWQGRDGRLHDRFRYARAGDGWQLDRLAP